MVRARTSDRSLPVSVFAVVAGVVLMAFALGACGSGGSHAAGSTSSTTPSKAEFIQSADAICAPVTSKIQALPPLGDNPTATQIAAEVRETIGIIEPALTSLKNLPGSSQDHSVLNDNLIMPTEKQDAAAHTLLDQLAAAGSDTSKQQAALQAFQSAASDPHQKAHDAALATYGFDACSKTNQ